MEYYTVIKIDETDKYWISAAHNMNKCPGHIID